jgi:hypothetical protein
MERKRTPLVRIQLEIQGQTKQMFNNKYYSKKTSQHAGRRKKPKVGAWGIAIH